ncbi:MAG: MBL fold metallo-hydrolase [Spirochaetaceae bacterium]|nr:MBL fold metallo-hydrolase [Spirochaetaceae bacterium]
MDVRFWGVRGSIPTPLTAQQIRTKIEAVVQRISARDIASLDAKERFLNSLPASIYGTVGGNTACVEIRDSQGTVFLLDSGTGIREFGKKGIPSVDNTYHILLSHFHWDHIQGLPFFDPAYRGDCKLIFYSAFPAAKKVLSKQMDLPYFPVQFDTGFFSSISFQCIKPGEPFKVGGCTIVSKKMSHPGNSYSYAFMENGKKIIYATDVELSEKDIEDTESNRSFFQNADAIILDTQYTVEESLYKVNWGHSAFSYAVDFASKWGIKKLYLFHHEPTYDDKKLNSILLSAQWYSQYVVNTDLKIFLAQEGLCFDV